MPAITIKIPVGHVEAIRRSLLDRRGDAERPDEIDALLAQLGSGAAYGVRSCELTGSRAVLWSAVYGSLCAAAEQLAEDCNEYWHGSVSVDSARAAVTEVGTWLELLVGLGAPPGS